MILPKIRMIGVFGPPTKSARDKADGRAVRARQNVKFGIALNLPPMEAKLSEALPKEGGWQYEPKWDEFRCLAFKAGSEVVPVV